MLIHRASLIDGQAVDLRVQDGRIAQIAPHLPAHPGEPVFDARGGALLPGLHDHHLHLHALAAARASVICGPPQVRDADALAARLHAQAGSDAAGWLRGIGYHESVAGDIDAAWLDRCVADRPLRIQHRSGRLWVLNSAALRALGAFERGGGDDPLERRDGRPTGRLYDADDWLRTRLHGQRPNLADTSRWLASRGVTAVTDTTHTHTRADLHALAAAHARGEVLQALMVMGDASLDAAADMPGVQVGAHKFHLHEHALPDFTTLCAQIRRSHACDRGAAFHCVTRTELVFALAALREAGVHARDRIEHAAIAPPELATQLAELGLPVITQPGFIAERGDAYRREVAPDDRPWLYRLRGWLDAGVRLAGSTDAPFGGADPWAAMQAAVTRRAADGAALGAHEALTPEQALALFTAPLSHPGPGPVQPAVGTPADLCVLDRPWAEARADLGAVQVRLSVLRERVLHR